MSGNDRLWLVRESSKGYSVVAETTREEYKVEWTYQGEGMDGKFNKDISTDIPLLRFTCYQISGSGNWWPVECGSWCCWCWIVTPIPILVEYSNMLLNDLFELHGDDLLDRLTERSWLRWPITMDDVLTERSMSSERKRKVS